MTTDTVLTDAQIEEIRHRAVMAFDGTMQPFEIAARAIEQAVLQSPEVQQMREDAERYRDWRAAAISENSKFLDAAYAYQEEHFPEGRPTEAQFDAGVDAARAAAMEKKE